MKYLCIVRKGTVATCMEEGNFKKCYSKVSEGAEVTNI